jgi:hypothetical protein
LFFNVVLLEYFYFILNVFCFTFFYFCRTLVTRDKFAEFTVSRHKKTAIKILKTQTRDNPETSDSDYEGCEQQQQNKTKKDEFNRNVFHKSFSDSDSDLNEDRIEQNSNTTSRRQIGLVLYDNDFKKIEICEPDEIIEV